MVKVGDVPTLELKFKVEDILNRHDRLKSNFMDDDYFHKDFTFKYENDRNMEDVRKEKKGSQ